MNDEQPAIPCGLVAKSFFNDTFKLYKCDTEDCKDFTTTGKNPVAFDEKNIAWDSDKLYKFNNIKQSTFPPGINNW